MKHPQKLFNALRFAGLLSVIVLGLVSIIGTGGGGGSSHNNNNQLNTYYLDSDGDGYGDPDVTTESASRPQGYVTDDTDCDDADAAVHPGATEVCGDARDNDCNGQIDEGCSTGGPWVPDTGQTTCYDLSGNAYNRCPYEGDEFYGQDACYDINEPSYTKLDAGGNVLSSRATSWSMVRDNVTGLIWETKTNDGGIHDKDNAYTWHDAEDVFIAQLNADGFGGYTDWRLPTLEELRSIVNYGDFIPSVDSYYFPLIMADMSSRHWTASPAAFDTNFAWRLYFYNGVDDATNKGDQWSAIAVRGRQSGAWDNLASNSNGTVTDDNTGLVWLQRTADVNNDGMIDDRDQLNWQEALAWCESLVYAGHDDWRLPTIKELATIVDLSRQNPAIDTGYFPDTVASGYWTSTSASQLPGCAWKIDFAYGNSTYFGESGDLFEYSKSSEFYVRPVRGGE
ncbi:MAG: DUF1566 domain-containing protein [Thermodesulfobacteriota bacterium]